MKFFRGPPEEIPTPPPEPEEIEVTRQVDFEAKTRMELLKHYEVIPLNLVFLKFLLTKYHEIYDDTMQVTFTENDKQYRSQLKSLHRSSGTQIPGEIPLDALSDGGTTKVKQKIYSSQGLKVSLTG